MLTLTEMAGMVRRGEVSAAELVEYHLRRIEAESPRLNAFTRVLADEARAGARRVLDGPLAGVPVTVKDSFDVAGLPTLCGSPFRLNHRAARDATAVARLRAAGAVLIGKTNCPEFLMNYESDNHVTGRTNNPWNPGFTAGGSSGGEAAAIASGCSAGGIGSDGGGSIRWPAHACGICGLKPTPGRVSAAGHEPPIAHPGGLLGVAGPMARTIADLRLLFRVVAGPDDADPFSAPVATAAPLMNGLRIGLVDFGMSSPALDAAAQAAAALRIPVEPFAWPHFGHAVELWRFFFWRVNWIFIAETIAGREDEVHWTGLEWFAEVRGQPPPTAKELLANLAARDRLRAHFLERLGPSRVLLAPVAGTPAFAHRWRGFGDGDLLHQMRPLTVFNLLGLPAVVLPFGFDRELPVGVQLVGRPYEEELLLDIAARLEEARGPFPEPTLVSAFQ